MNTWLAPVFIGVAPQAPVYGGRPPKGWAVSSGGQNQDRLILLASGALAPSSSQSPLYSGRPSVGIRHVASLRLLSPPNPLRWALAGTPIKYLRCTDTAYSGKAVAAGLSDHRRTQQEWMYQAVYVRSQMLSNFDGKRPLWAEWRRETDLDFARRKLRTNQSGPTP